jgi:hypothetical protein
MSSRRLKLNCIYTNYLCGGIVPLEFKDDSLYQQPTEEEIRAVKEEKKERKNFRDDINEKKSKLESDRKQALRMRSCKLMQ